MKRSTYLIAVLMPLCAAPSLDAAEGNGGLFKKLFGKKKTETTSITRGVPQRRSRSAFFAAPRSHSSTQSRASQPTGDVRWARLEASNRSSNRLVVDVSRQKAYLLNSSGDKLLTTPVSTARPGKYTPRGTFTMQDRVRSGKVSTIYNVAMPYWMRLGGSVYGVHAGYLPGYPASAGCVRLPYDMARLIYENTTYGTRVSILSSWSGSF